jgi:hypothetical protein
LRKSGALAILISGKELLGIIYRHAESDIPLARQILIKNGSLLQSGNKHRKVLDLNQSNKVISNDTELLTFHHFSLNNSSIVSHLKVG